MLIASLAFSAALLAPTVDVAQQPVAAQEADSPVRLQDLHVYGRQRDEIIRDFVDNVADPVRGRPLARFRDQVCVSVVNLEPQSANFIVERVSHVAREVGLRTGGPGCRANVVLIASSDPSGEARALAQRYRYELKPNITGAAQSKADFEAFQHSDAPIRWWYRNAVTGLDTGRPAHRVPGDSISGDASELPVTHVMPSRLLTSLSEDITYAIAIFNPANSSI